LQCCLQLPRGSRQQLVKVQPSSRLLLVQYAHQAAAAADVGVSAHSCVCLLLLRLRRRRPVLLIHARQLGQNLLEQHLHGTNSK
jgi:hypothetical protein